jgi:aspartate-semialdehyde dehydrogenase
LIGDSHPQFTIHALGASPRSAGKLYPDAVNWKLAEEIPSSVSTIEVRTCEPTGPFTECDIVFSGLDADVAGDIGSPSPLLPRLIVEMAFLKANIPIFSNAKNYRRAKHIPLVVPVVNTEHISPLLASQRELYGLSKKGFMVTNANCSTTGLVVPLKALQDKFGGFAKVSAVTMQAISGAGKNTPVIGGGNGRISWSCESGYFG